MPMLAKVEGMPLQSLRSGVPWNWRSTAEYLDALDRRLVINVGFMVGHSALRRVVMGEAANERAATDEELEQMIRLLRDGLDAGAFGFSTTTSDTHNDADGNPVPSRFAASSEFLALATVCGEYEGTSLELLPKGATDRGGFPEDVAELMIAMSAAAQRPLNWNVISPTAGNLDSCLAKLEVGDRAATRGGKVVGLTMPVDMKARFSFHAGFVLDVFKGWAPIMNATTEREAPRTRRPGAARPPGGAGGRHAQHAAPRPVAGPCHRRDLHARDQPYAGRRVGDIAEELGKEPFDTLVDIAIADDLRTTFARATPEPTAADWDARLQIWNDKRAMIGASDAGAHLDMIAAFRYSTGFLEEAVRQHELLPLERAVHLLTGAPARLYGLRDRGVLAEGGRADVVVFDEATVGSQPVGTRFDLPGGAGRLYAEANGIDHVIVNGTEIAADGAYTGERAGVIMRAGRDSATPTLEL